MMRKLVAKAAYAGHSCANATASGSCTRCAAARAGSARAGHGDGEDAVAERLRAACLAHGRRVIWIVHVELYTGLGSATPTAANARCQLIWALQRGEVAQACDVLQSDIGSVKGGTSADSGWGLLPWPVKPTTSALQFNSAASCSDDQARPFRVDSDPRSTPRPAPFGCIIIEDPTLKPAVKLDPQHRPWRTSSSQRGSTWPARSPS
jgi:hypothetical protein